MLLAVQDKRVTSRKTEPWKEYGKMSSLCTVLPTVLVIISDAPVVLPRELAGRVIIVSGSNDLELFFGPLLAARRLNSEFRSVSYDC